MELKIEIDNKSGFCHGVVRAIGEAEKYIDKGETLKSLGSIVHNSSELDRLSDRGLSVIGKEDLEQMKGGSVLFRAHGEPPESYEIAVRNNVKIIDCTCPVVLKLQSRVRDSYNKLKSEGGAVAIFGKKGHAEVNGLAGQIGGDVTIIENIEDIEKLDFKKPINIFSQTTKDRDEYSKVCAKIRERIEESAGPIDKFRAFNTICGQVSGRQPHLKEFSSNHSVIIFVAGSESSNGKVLYELCKSINSRSYKIERPSEISPEWFCDGDSVGICGATSTPRWQLEEVSDYISKL